MIRCSFLSGSAFLVVITVDYRYQGGRFSLSADLVKILSPISLFSYASPLGGFKRMQIAMLYSDAFFKPSVLLGLFNFKM